MRKAALMARVQSPIGALDKASIFAALLSETAAAMDWAMHNTVTETGRRKRCVPGNRSRTG